MTQTSSPERAMQREMSQTDNLRAEIEKISQRPCQCVPCDFCRGNGTYRVDVLTGLPQTGFDDLYDLETCEECHGGIIEVCDRCRETEELYQQMEEIEERELRSDL